MEYQLPKFPLPDPSQMSDEELDRHIDKHNGLVRVLLGGECLHNERSRNHLVTYVDPYAKERDNRRSEKNRLIRENEERDRRAKRMAGIIERRPINPTLDDIPNTPYLESYQRIIASHLGCAVTRDDKASYTVYEFDPEDWIWRKYYYSTRRDALRRSEGCEIDQEYLEFCNSRVDEIVSQGAGQGEGS